MCIGSISKFSDSGFPLQVIYGRQNGSFLTLRCNVPSTISQRPPTRIARSRRRFSPRLKRHPRELLPRFEIMDPAHSKVHFLPHRVPNLRPPGIVENHIFRSFRLSRVLFQNPGHRQPSRYRGGCENGRGMLDIGFFSCCALGGEHRRYQRTKLR